MKLTGGRLKIVRPSSRESGNSLAGVSKQSIRSQQPEGVEPLSRNTSIQSIGISNPKLALIDKRMMRPFETGTGVAFLGQHTTTAQQAQQKEEIVNKLVTTQRVPSGEPGVHLPSIHIKPGADKPLMGTLRLGRPDQGQNSNFRMRTAEGEKRGADVVSSGHQPRIMRQNVPYKPLSSHAASRPTPIALDTPKSEPKASQPDNKRGTHGLFQEKDIKTKQEYSIEPSSSNENLFFANIERESNNPSLRVSDSNRNGASFNGSTRFETNVDEHRISLQYYESFGKNTDLNLMCQQGKVNPALQSALEDDLLLKSSLTDKMNFTFGASELQQELPKQSTLYKAIDETADFSRTKRTVEINSTAHQQPLSQLETVHKGSEKEKTRLKLPTKSLKDKPVQDISPGVSRENVKPRLPIKIVSSASKPTGAPNDGPEGSRLYSRGRPPRLSSAKKDEDIDKPQEKDGERSARVNSFATNLRSEKLVVRRTTGKD